MISIPKRVPKQQADVLDYIANKKEQAFVTVIKNVINDSVLYQEFLKEYELTKIG